MKNLFCLLIFISGALTLTAQNDDAYRIVADSYDQDTCGDVVIAFSGLKLRAKPQFDSKTIAVIPLGEKIKYTCGSWEVAHRKMVYDTDSVAGYWYHVFWKGKQGFAFSGYLGRGILKMNKPFYLLSENSAWCWDDAYISPDFYYYGVYANADSTSFEVKKQRPLFFNNNTDGMGGITFSFRQKQASYFAFASKAPSKEGRFQVSKSSQEIRYEWNTQPGPEQKIQVPHTSWEIKTKMETALDAGGSSYDTRRLIILDNKTGAWHYLFDASLIHFSTVQLGWSGDMDGDGIQDFMLNIGSDHSGGMMLFLSKDPGKWKFVKMAGIYFWGDCC
jgi:hypothetical protein